MFCTKCGNEIAENQVCSCSQQQQAAPAPQQPPVAPAPAPAPAPQPAPNTNYAPPPPNPGYNPNQGYNPGNQFTPPPSDNRKVYSILSYISVLWLIGMFAAPEKNDPRVRFNVGQGIMLSIVSAGLWIVVGIISAILTAVFGRSLYGFVTYVPVGVTIVMSLLWLASSAVTITLMIIGIVNVNKNADKPLPIIGSMVFYK